jgi:hypothetical protein
MAGSGVEEAITPFIAAPPAMSPGGSVNYFPPFEVIRRSVDIQAVRGDLRVNMSYEDFVKLLKLMISGIHVDEDWYVRAYDDIGQAIKAGGVRSARQHFINDGYFEGRLPAPIRVDEAWYLRRYPDVAEGIRKGILNSAQEHFDMDGYKEGRLPFEM